MEISLKKFKLGLTAAAACVVMAAAAQAIPVSGQISLGGYAAAVGSVGMAAATGLDFVANGSAGLSPGTAGGITSFGAGSGSFSGFACASLGGSCGSIKDLASFSTGPLSSFLTLANGSTTVSFDLASLSVTSRDFGSNTISLTATGVINETGYSATAGTFILTAQGDSITSFSATTLAAANNIPEPASLAILGGSLAAIGLVRRKKA